MLRTSSDEVITRGRSLIADRHVFANRRRAKSPERTGAQPDGAAGRPAAKDVLRKYMQVRAEERAAKMATNEQTARITERLDSMRDALLKSMVSAGVPRVRAAIPDDREDVLLLQVQTRCKAIRPKDLSFGVRAFVDAFRSAKRKPADPARRIQLAAKKLVVVSKEERQKVDPGRPSLTVRRIPKTSPAASAAPAARIDGLDELAALTEKRDRANRRLREFLGKIRPFRAALEPVVVRILLDRGDVRAGRSGQRLAAKTITFTNRQGEAAPYQLTVDIGRTALAEKARERIAPAGEHQRRSAPVLQSAIEIAIGKELDRQRVTLDAFVESLADRECADALVRSVQRVYDALKKARSAVKRPKVGLSRVYGRK